MASQSGPEPGDVNVRRTLRNNQDVFVLCRASESEQLVTADRGHAERVAIGVATSYHVRAWLNDATSGFVLLHDKGRAMVDSTAPSLQLGNLTSTITNVRGSF